MSECHVGYGMLQAALHVATKLKSAAANQRCCVSEDLQPVLDGGWRALLTRISLGSRARHEQMKSRQFPLRVLANGLKEGVAVKLGGDLVAHLRR